MKKIDSTNSELKKAIEIIGDKWSLLILKQLIDNGPQRFGECQRVEGINTKTLAKRLVTLEEHGLITKHQYNEYPPRTEYEITKKGQSLAPILVSLTDWARKI
jgi:DNA-binding HxlR family transcriptional regulator